MKNNKREQLASVNPHIERLVAETFMYVQQLNNVTERHPELVIPIARRHIGWPGLISRKRAFQKKNDKLLKDIQLGNNYALTGEWQPDAPATHLAYVVYWWGKQWGLPKLTRKNSRKWFDQVWRRMLSELHNKHANHLNTMPRTISKATWDQIKIARAAGASYGELAERTGISKGTILAHAHRNGWTKDIALARPKGDREPSAPNVTDAITAILHERGQETKMKMSEFLLKAARQLAERDDIVVDSLEGAKILEALRSSLYPQPVMVDHRSLNVSLQGGLSEEALQRIEAMAKLM